MRTARTARRVLMGLGLLGALGALGTSGCGLFQSEMVAKGNSLYNHYCMHCHGEHGYQNEGFNWSRMPDPRPRDLSDETAMSTFSDEQLFHAVSRKMKDTTPGVGDKIGAEEFAVPTMPTFKYTLAEEEIWAVIAYVRTLHGMELTYDLESRKKELKERLAEAQEQFNQAEQAMKKVEEESPDDEDAFFAAEERVMEVAQVLEEAKQAHDNFFKRPNLGRVTPPTLKVSNEERATLVETGKRLYHNKYGCNGCHTIDGQGGLVGPNLDRAGFRLQGSWIYQWVKNPQFFKDETRMPALGLSDEDAKAVTIFLKSLGTPPPPKPAVTETAMESQAAAPETEMESQADPPVETDETDSTNETDESPQ